MPFDPLPPSISSGLRIGTPALATRGFADEDFREVGKIIATALSSTDWNETKRVELRDQVRALAARFPLYEFLNEEQSALA